MYYLHQKYTIQKLRRQHAMTTPCSKHRCSSETGNASGLCNHHQDIAKIAARLHLLHLLGWFWRLPTRVIREVQRQVFGIEKP